VRTEAAVVSGGLELVRTQDFGTLGTGTINLVLGQSSATLNNALAVPVGPEPVPPAGGDVLVPGPIGAGPVVSSPVGVATPRTPTGPSAAAPIDTRRTAAAEPFDAKGIYLLVIGAAAIIVGIGPILRVLPTRGTPEG
jgi:hypothetical protein